MTTRYAHGRRFPLAFLRARILSKGLRRRSNERVAALQRNGFTTIAIGVASLVLFTSNGAAAADSGASVPPDSPSVSTLAGSGAVGTADGPGDSASFVAPAGIAYGSDGQLYVADRDAQRIRIVSKAGVVGTLAGSGSLVSLGIAVPGGYRDGPAPQAQFNMPSAVLPLPGGSVLVADTYNHCLRSVRSGMVTTFAGDLAAGSADGSARTARFARPMAFARDASGNVYVADPPNGLRRVDTRGHVTTLHFNDSRAIVAVAWTADAPTKLLVATVSKIERVDTVTLAVDRGFPLELSFVAQPAQGGETILREGSTNAGPVSALAAFATNDFIYTDALDSAVRLGQTEHGSVILNYTRVLTAVPPENASDGISGFADGPGATALVDEPAGIAIAPDGTVAVADTGNRRIRTFSAFNRRTHLTTDEAQTELPARPDPREYRIALVGSSYVSWDQAWHDSLAGRVEDQLRAGDHGPRVPRVLPIMRLGIDTLGSLSLIDGVLSDGVVDMVVLDFSTYAQMGGDGYAGNAFPAGWQAAMQSALAKTAATLRSNGIPFLVLNMPGSSDFPGENAYFRIPKGLPEDHSDTGTQNVATNVQSYHDAIAAVLQASGVATLDLWPALLTAYTAPNRIPLYNAWDHHLSGFGRSVVASGLAHELLASKPWTAAQAVHAGSVRP